MKHIEKTNIFGTSNVGLYVTASDTYTLVGMALTEAECQKIQSVLQTPILQTTICGTSLVGVFVHITNECVFVPEIAFDHEIEKLRETGLQVVVVPTLLTALGNNMIYTHKTLIVSSEFEETAIESIKKQIPVEKVVRLQVADTDVIGSCVVYNTKGGIVHPFADDETLDILEKELSVPLTKGSVNYQSPYIRSGLVANSHGFIIGNDTSGPEIANIDEGLGFLE